MKPNCFYLRLDRSKSKNGYYIVLIELARNILDLALLLKKQFNKLLSFYWCLYYCFPRESWLVLSKKSAVHRLEKEERPRVADRRKGTRSDAVSALTAFHGQLPTVCEEQSL